MPRGTIMIISILAILMLTSSLMGFVANISVDTNYDGEAYIEIENSSTHEVVDRIPNGYGETFEITTTSNNTQQSCDLPSNCGYIATVHASKEVNPIITVTDTDSNNFHYGTATFTLTVDLSGDGSIPDDPPAGD